MSWLTLLLLVLALLVSASLSFPFAEKLQIDPWGKNSVRIRISPTGTIVDPEVQALLPTPPQSSTPNINLQPNLVTNGNIKAEVDASGKLSISRISDGTVLLEEISHSFSPNSDNLFSALLKFSAKSEGIYGLGEHRTGKLQNKPIFIDFQKSQIYDDSRGGDISIPFYVSTLGYGFLWNLPSFGYVSIDNTQTVWSSNSTQQLDFWVTTWNSTLNYGEIMSQYVDVTGHPPVLPDFATGFWQCKDRYRNQTEILAVGQGYYSRNIPVSIIIIDWQHWIHLGDWSFNPACWQDPASMVNFFSSHGTHTVVSVWPLVDKASKNFDPMNNGGYLIHDRNGVAQPFHSGQFIYDPFNQDARKYVWQQVKSGYYDKGIKLYWLDAAEPERNLPDQSGQYYYKSGRDLQVGMAFPLLHQHTFHDGLVAQGDPPLFLSRSAWAGSQRLGAAVWSGDVFSTFAELAIQVRAAQNVAMSGIYWWTTDIGGYWGGNIQDPVFQELIVRWFQFGAFCPLFRLHGHRQPEDPPSPCGGSGGLNEIWEFGNTAYNAITQMISLREKLRGYVSANLKIASERGIPVLRPMFFDFPNDAKAYAAEDQFMFGPDWLVAPVLQYKATSRDVYLPSLPASQTWTHYYTNKVYSSGTVNVPVTIDTFPLFFRGSPIDRQKVVEKINSS